MKRKIYNDLLAWKAKDGKTALLIEGARRIVKSYITEEFARQEYASYILVDFNKVGTKVKRWFAEYMDDLPSLFELLEQYYHVKLVHRNSLIIFDEVQMCPRARAAIKYLVADGRFDYLETGSLVSIKKNVKNIVIPSEEEAIQMYPMDFEEFLWAMGDEVTMDVIRRHYESNRPMKDMHRDVMDKFRRYLIVGGMPQAVQTYVDTRDFDQVDAVKRMILTIYRNDINKYAGRLKLKATAIFDDIPAQLRNNERRFCLADLQSEARMRDFESAFLWLSDAKIVNCCYNTVAPNVGLRLNMERTTLRCYMADTGLLISHAFDEKGIVSSELYKKLLTDKLEVNAGMMMENMVAQMLVANGHKLYFYNNPDREDKENRMELDFLIQKDTVTNRHNIIPLEVKSSSGYTLTSLKKCMKKFDEFITLPTVLHASDGQIEDGIRYLPLYMTPCL